MTWRKLKTFVNSTISLLLSSSIDPGWIVRDADVITHLLRTRILPEVEAMREDAFETVGEIQSSIIRLVLELLRVGETSNREWMLLYFSHWLQEGGNWRQSVENPLREFVSGNTPYDSASSLLSPPSQVTHGEWPVVLRLIPVLEMLPDDVRGSLIPQLLPAVVEVCPLGLHLLNVPDIFPRSASSTILPHSHASRSPNFLSPRRSAVRRRSSSQYSPARRQ